MLPTSDSTKVQSKGMERILQANGNQKKARAVILMPDKVDLKLKMATSDKKDHYIMIQGSIPPEDKMIINISQY